jgi:hypothetical protein
MKIIFSCDLCRKGFLHQTQLYSHHKQRHSNESQNTELFTFDPTQEKQEFSNDPANLFLETQ